ncbi:vegetative cell wall protein gp1-like [Zingiber officinale]|uniref:vegetative cell wall protein gp1-like n=1 Tax=Zingiber officinale TaxID=94328 RepID=UPI001C4CE531|nr:vegetative cell wall protein gp1-like [Zingiber officinale]
MEIMRRGRVILQRRSLPHSSSTSVGGTSSADSRPRPPRRGSSTVRPASIARPTRPRTTRPPRPVAPISPRAPPTARPFTPTPLQSINPPQPTYIPGRGLGRRFANVPQDSPAFREASQAARRARSTNDRLDREAPSPSRRRARLPSEDSDSDDQPLAQRLRRQAPHPVLNSGPSSIPSPSPPMAVTSPPSPPIATLPPVPSQTDVPPDPPAIPVEPPTAQPSPPAQPPTQSSTSQQHQSTEASPSRRSLPATSPPEPSPVPQSAPSRSAAGPSSSAARPSQPPPPVPLYYRTTAPSKARLQSRRDVPTSSLTMKGRLATVWEESRRQMELLPPLAQMDRFSELYIKASHTLRAEVKALTKKKNSLEVSLTISDQKLKDLKEEKSQVEVVHQQLMDQQTLEHQRAMDQLAQKLRVAETLAQEKKLKSQEAQLTSQAEELLATRTELAQARTTAEGVSTALAIYKYGENDRCQQSRALYLRSPEFCTQAGQRFSTFIIYGAAEALRQLYEQDYLKSTPPPEFLDHDRILKESPDEIFAPFK